MSANDTNKENFLEKTIVTFDELDGGYVGFLYLEEDLQLSDSSQKLKVLKSKTVIFPYRGSAREKAFLPKIGSGFFLSQLHVRLDRRAIFRYREVEYRIAYVSLKSEA